jgi:hypothetical protein
MKKIRLLSLVCILTLLLCSCSAKSDRLTVSDMEMSGSYDKGYDVPNASPMAPSAPGAALDSMVPEKDYYTGSDSVAADKIAESERKLIKNGNFTVETLEYEKTIDAIEQLISSVGGYVQNSNVSGTGAIASGYNQMRRATYTVRLPASDFESFEDGLAACGGAILSRNVFVDEVTDYYYDTEARLKSLQTQEDQLMKLLQKADKLEVIIQLQNELSNVRYQIESMQGTLRRLDSQVAYSTVTINVREVYESTAIQAPPKTLGQRIAYTFSNTWDNIVDGVEDFVVFVAGNILLLVFWGAIIAAVITIVVRRIRRRKIKKTVIKPENEDESND